MPLDLAQIRRVFAAPFTWGTADCCTAPSDGFRLLHGVDPMALLRGRYTTFSGAARASMRMGGFEHMAQACAGDAGLFDGVGAVGEIGLVDMTGLPAAPHFNAALALRMPDGWWVKMENGVLVAPDALRSWRA